MRRLKVCLACWTICSGFLIGVIYAQNDAPNSKFTMSLSAEKSVVHLGEDIAISLKITNISDGPVTLTFGHRGNAPCCYQYDIRDDQGAPVAKVPWPPPPYPTMLPGEYRDDTLPPGQIVTSDWTISDIYQFPRPGKYTLQVSKYASKAKGEQRKVYSNTITITVLPAADHK
jgi:hypothetical protein